VPDALRRFERRGHRRKHANEAIDIWHIRNAGLVT
jgi:hypothetical protein